MTITTDGPGRSAGRPAPSGGGVLARWCWPPRWPPARRPTRRHRQRLVDQVDHPAVGLQRPHRHHRHHRCRSGNVSTLVAGLFKGAAVGTEAYADYVNSDGWDLRPQDHRGQQRRRLLRRRPTSRQTQADVQKDVAMVGRLLAGGQLRWAGAEGQSRRCPTSPSRSTWPPPTSPTPSARPRPPTGGSSVRWSTSRRSSPTTSSTPGRWWPTSRRPSPSGTAEKAAMESHRVQGGLRPDLRHHPDRLQPERHRHEERRGEDPVPRADARELRRRGGQGPQPAGLPSRCWCSAARPTASSWCPTPEGPSAIDGAYMEQNTSLYLGEDASGIPAVNTFLTWVQKASPGFKADLYTLLRLAVGRAVHARP